MNWTDVQADISWVASAGGVDFFVEREGRRWSMMMLVPSGEVLCGGALRYDQLVSDAVETLSRNGHEAAATALRNAPCPEPDF